jgi:hypothetical protein
MELSITSEVVRWAYQLFLDREPENETVVEEKATTCRNTLELRRVFMRSEEFKSKNAVFATLSGHESPIIVDFSISNDELQKTFAHIQSSWTSLGLNDPYYSVLTRGKFWKKQMSKSAFQNIGQEFYRSLFISYMFGFRVWCRTNQPLAIGGI